MKIRIETDYELNNLKDLQRLLKFIERVDTSDELADAIGIYRSTMTRIFIPKSTPQRPLMHVLEYANKKIKALGPNNKEITIENIFHNKNNPDDVSSSVDDWNTTSE